MAVGIHFCKNLQGNSVLTPSNIWSANIFSHLVGCLIILWMVSFSYRSFLVWCSLTGYFCFCCLCFCCPILKKSSPNPMSRNLLIVFSSKNFVVSDFSFNFFVHFELILEYCARFWSTFSFFGMWLYIFPTLFVQEAVFSPTVYSWILSHELIDCICVYVYL